MEKQELMVTIRCLAYNHEPYIRRCLEGFVMQKTNFSFKAIVHDDASTDGTASIIREYAEKYPDIIKPILENENQYSKHDGSLTKIMNEHMHGKYIAICEGDDYWIDPMKLQKQVDFLEANPECSISFCKVQCVSANNMKLNQTIPFNSNIKKGIVTLADYIREEFRNGYWTFHTSSFVFRSDLLLGYSKIIQNEFRKFPYGDMPILLYCLLNGNGCYISDIGSCYRMLSGGYNSKINTDKNFKISQERKLIYALRDFDRYTNYLYHKDVEIKIKRSNYIIESTIYGKIIYLKPQYWILLLQSIKRKLFSLLNKSKNNETI